MIHGRKTMQPRSLCLARHSLKLYLSDPAPLVVFLLMPLGLMAFMSPLSKALLHAQGYMNATGAEQAVPGMTIMFSFMSMSVVGIQFYREYGWGTWDRLRIASGGLSIIVGKTLPGLLLLLCQIVVVFVAGGVLFGLHVTGSFVGLLIVFLAFALCTMSLTMALIAWCRTLDQLQVITNLVALLFSGIGGSFAPVDSLPSWAGTMAVVSPAYWALRGMRGIILDKQGFGFGVQAAGMLLGFALLFAILASIRFNMKEIKVSDT
jgi:ABC-2 type transport system permease protein